MLVSVGSVYVVGVWVCVGSGTTWCHSVCLFCDPVVTLLVSSEANKTEKIADSFLS